ncbi:16S rRNA (cytosine(967)-C(5))-methyltransferase RsmB [Caldalkalibacillus salinus]|uniref:16S rRNA (cytosine(967)-C(5))-methyltransferase RsmB n=1 Tax=Caldalkalibacillus salinus TaxID=2803787 RepID=UPI001923A2C6|nr:16S rRNA (cytosine(967)-C(5))-methyltransferase RsmB [Caldalkalibacillus salinus]
MVSKKHLTRTLALKALEQIEQGGAYSNLMLNRLLQGQPDMDKRDKHLMTEIVYGTLQHLRIIDFYLQPLLKKPLNKLDPWVKQLLRLSVYQIHFLDRVPDRAIVHEAVEIAKIKGHRGISGMVNGVLRAYLRSERPSLDTLTNKVERLAIQTSHPTWLVDRWDEQYGYEDTRLICEANNRPPRMTLRVNQLKATREDVMTKLETEGYKVQPSTIVDEGVIVLEGGNVTQSSLFSEGYFTIQDESSMLIPHLLDPQPGMRVLDACAAPGGKTTHLAEYMRDEGQILAVDLHPHKEKLVRENAQRLGTSIVDTLTADARLLQDQTQESFDRILLDAPCSGFGVIRRKPDLKWSKTESDIAQISKVQLELLKKVSPLLKPGGHLVYSTCTIEKEENQSVIGHFLADHTDFHIVPDSERQILPQHFGSDGFYMIKLQRNFGD